MQRGLEYFVIDNFQGVRNWEQDNRIPKSNLYYAINSDFDGGMWYSSKGVQAYLSTLVGGTNTKCLLYYPYNSAGVVTHYMIQVYDNIFYKIDLTTNTRTAIIGTAFLYDEPLGSTVYNNDCYFVSPNNGMAWYDGTTWHTDFEAGQMTAITVTDGGSGYLTIPAISFSGGGGGSGAEAIVDGITLTGINVTVGGTGYTLAPTVTIAPPNLAGGVQASAHAVVTAGVVTSVVLDDPGYGYDSIPAITFTPNGAGSGAAAGPILKVRSIRLIDPGSSFTSAPTVVIDAPTGPSPVTAVATATYAAGTPPPGNMIAINSERMWVAGVPAFPNVIYNSRTATVDFPEHIRDWITDSSASMIGHGGKITAIRNLKNTLYVFKTDSVYYLSGFNDAGGSSLIPNFQPYAVTAGAINNNCVTEVENDLWFLTPNLEVRTLGSLPQYINDNRTSDLSLAIKRFIKELDSDQSGAAMNYTNKVLKIALKTRGSASNNFVLSYDLNNTGWKIERLQSPKFYVTANGVRYYCEDGTSGRLFKDDTGYTNNGSPFAWSGRCVMFDAGRPAINKKLRYINIHLGRTAGQITTVNLYKDSFDATPTSYTLEAPTATETGSVTSSTDGLWGGATFGGSVFGGAGSVVGGDEQLYYYRRVFRIDVDQTGKQFGVELAASINGGGVRVEQVEYGWIPRNDKNKAIDV